MSTPDDTSTNEAARSSFKLTRNAKGETQIEVKTYALGDNEVDENDARTRALHHYKILREEYPS